MDLTARLLAITFVLTATSCGSAASTAPALSNAAPTTMTTTTLPTTTTTTAPTPPKPAIALIALGDSITAGAGDEKLQGYPPRLAEALTAEGHNVVQVVNLGRSGWTSQLVVDGWRTDRSQLAQAQEAIEAHRSLGTTVVVTFLIGSNDLWYLYSGDAPTTAQEEQDNLVHYRANVERVVSTLTLAGAIVAVAIADDQAKRPAARERALRQRIFPGFTDAEVPRMSAQARAYADGVRQIAATNGARIADFLDAPFFADPATLAIDGDHPNGAGYDEMTKVWLAALQPAL